MRRLALKLKSFPNKPRALLAGGKVEMLVDGRCWAEVVVFEVNDGEAEIDEGIVGGVETRENRVVNVNSTLCFIVNIKECCTRTTDGYTVVKRDELDRGVHLQLLPHGFLWCGSEKEGGILNLHHLEYTGLRTIVSNCGQHAFGVLAEEIQCLLYHSWLMIVVISSVKERKCERSWI